MSTKKLLSNKVIDSICLLKLNDDELERLFPNIEARSSRSLYLFSQMHDSSWLTSTRFQVEKYISTEEAISIYDICANALYECMNKNNCLNNDGNLYWMVIQTFISYTWDMLSEVCDVKQLYMDSIEAAKTSLGLNKTDTEENPEERKPVEVIEVKPKTKQKDLAKPQTNKNLNPQVAEIVKEVPKIKPVDSNVSKVAAVIGNNDNRIRPDFSKLIQHPEPQQGQSVQQVFPTIQPTATQVNVPVYNPMAAQQPVVQQPQVQQEVPQQSIQQVPNVGQKRLPKYVNKPNIYNTNTLDGVPFDDKVAMIKKHYNLITGSHKGTTETQLDVLISLISLQPIYNSLKRNKVNVPADGITFTEIPLQTHADKVDITKFDMAFRINEKTKSGENLVVYVNSMNRDAVTMQVFLPSAKSSKKNKEANRNHPEGCTCGQC